MRSRKTDGGCRGLLLAGLLGCALACTLSLSAAQPGKKTPVPSPAAQKKAEALVREVYEAEFAKAQTDNNARRRLAATLLQEGRLTDDNLAGKYVLFRDARDLAALSGDVTTALQAIEELSLHFAVQPAEAFAMKTRILRLASKAAASKENYQFVLDTALLLLEDALNDDDYEVARELGVTARAAAVKLRSVALVTGVDKRQKEVERLQKAFAPLKPFADALRKNPKDAKANLVMGKYQAFIKGNWDRGLEMLARSDNPTLATLAKQDLAQPQAAEKQLALADAWWKRAGKANAAEKTQLLLHAYQWYQQAYLQSEDPPRSTIEVRMKTINGLLPAEYRSGEITGEVRKFEGAVGPVYGVGVSADGRRVAGGGADSAVHVWGGRSGKEQRRLNGHNGVVWAVTMSPDGRRVLSGGFDRTIRLWDALTGREVRQFSGHDDYVRSVVLSADGLRVLSGGDDRTVRLWSVETGSELKRFVGHDHFVWSVDLSRDGKRALSGSLDKTVRLWDVDSGLELKKLTGHKDTVMSVAFAPDGRRAVSGSTDKTLILWDLNSGKMLRTFKGHTGYVNAVAFAPDGRRILSASADGTVRLWDVESGQQVRELTGHNGQVWDVAFAQDGRWAVSGGQDGTVRLWGGAK